MLFQTVRIEFEVPWNTDGVRIACAALTTANLLMLRYAQRAGRPFPQLYSSGVRYKRQPMVAGQERFQPIPRVLRRGNGDCDQLACWRAAELQLQGELARAIPVRVNPRLMHVVVRRGDGRIEDPSKILGMKGAA